MIQLIVTSEQLNVLATIIVMCGALPALGFVLVYGIGSPWYKSPLGVVMFLLALSILLTLAQVITHRLLGDYPGFALVAVGTYFFVMLNLWALFVVLLRERRHARPITPNPLTPKGKK